MVVDYKYEIITEVMGRRVYEEVFSKTLLALAEHSVSSVSMMLGWAWFNADNERMWKPFSVPLSQVKRTVEDLQAEAQVDGNNTGSFGNDDVYLELSVPAIEMNFCHERDVHLWFNEESSLVFDLVAILESASSKLFRKVDGRAID